MTATDPTFDAADLDAITSLAALPVPPERVDGIVAVAQPIHGLYRSLAEIDYGDTPPSAAFVADQR